MNSMTSGVLLALGATFSISFLLLDGESLDLDSESLDSMDASAKFAWSSDPRGNPFGAGDPATVENKYRRWRIAHEEAGADRNVRIRLAWSRGFSDECTSALGKVRLNLIDGMAEARVFDLPEDEEFDLWLVDNLSGEGRSVYPEEGDRMIELGRLQRGDAMRELKTDVDLEDFTLDMVVVTRAGTTPVNGGFLHGLTSYFQDRYTAERKTHAVLESIAGVSLIAGPPLQTSFPALLPVPTLVEQGEKLFFRETFKGNGRTCGTCHPTSNNFTIDPEFIECLDDDDRLFIAEFNPQPPGIDLDEHFEKPALMRGAGLILENTNGFDPIETNFTMRSVPHMFAMTIAIDPPIGAHENRLGWSGDGSPTGVALGRIVNGSLKDFAVGAVRQHFPRTLARDHAPPLGTPDFRAPTTSELLAMEAFQLSLGRQAEIDLTALTFTDPRVERGRQIFTMSICNQCHLNAGATNGGGFNTNENTGIELIGDPNFGGFALADLIDPANNPPDDGFGSPGDATFNSIVLVEAADTGPFFHTNAIETIEGAVAFYSSEAFESVFGVSSGFTPTEIVAVAALLRVLNVQENIRQARVFVSRALTATSVADKNKFLERAAHEIEDAIEVLQCGGLHAGLRKKLEEALEKVQASLGIWPLGIGVAPDPAETADDLMDDVEDGLVE